MPPDTTPPAADASPPPGERLDSWKEIAAFLRRDVRTVQRWEKQASLPVHRHSESQLRSVYAYRSELDAWWGKHSALDGDPAVPVPGVAGRFGQFGRRRAVVFAGVLAAVVAVAIIAVMWRGKPPPVTVAGPSMPVTVLLTRITDQVGDPRLAALVEETIARQLREERGIEMAAPARVARLLRLMRRDPATPLTASVGREICLRDGGIRYVVAGRLHRLGSRYFVDQELIEPSDGHVQASFERQAPSAEALMPLVREEAAQLGRAVLSAAKTAAAGPEPLEPVTTASLPALRLYTAAIQAAAQRQWAASELLARRAVAADERFGSAQAWVGWAMRHQGRPAGESLPLAERAVALSADASDPEIYFINGVFHELSGDLPGALAAYEASLRRQPRDRRMLDLLVDAYARAGRFKDAVDMSVRRAEIDSGDFYANVRAARALRVWQGDKARAATFVRQSQQLATREAMAERPFWGAWLSGLPVFTSWLAGDIRAAAVALVPLENGLATRVGRDRDAYATTIGFSYLAMGRLQQAERAFRHAAAPLRQINLAMLALAVGDEAQARDWLLEISSHGRERPALFASVGLLAAAEGGIASAFGSEHVDGIAEITRGLIATRRGQTESAIASLRRGTELLRFSGEPEYFLGTEALAEIWIERGKVGRATRLLTHASEQRERAYGSPQWAGAYWIRLSARLVALHRREGRTADAERLSATLRQLLAGADARHPAAEIAGGGKVPPAPGSPSSAVVVEIAERAAVPDL
jgi:tetratricopeptide (TPR) repeat protein